jgi:hypothetical protein
MRRNAAELSQLREECRTAQSLDDLKQVLDAVIDHLSAVERPRDLRLERLTRLNCRAESHTFEFHKKFAETFLPAQTLRFPPPA